MESKVEGKVTSSWMGCKPFCDYRSVPYNYKCWLISAHCIPFLAWHKLFNIAHPGTKGDAQSCMAQLRLCNSTPSVDIAAQIVMLAPLWPGTSTVALFPITFLPQHRVLVKFETSLIHKYEYVWGLSAFNLHDSLN